MTNQKERASAPLNSRELFIAEMLGDIDQMLDKVEDCKLALTRTLEAVDAGSDRYRQAIIEFTEQAKQDIAAAVNREFAKTNEQERAAMQEAARLAFRSEASDRAHDLARVLQNLCADMEQLRLTRFKESAIIAAASSVLTSLVVVFVLRHL